MTFSTESHHCYRLAKHKAVPIDHQLQYCLNENHIRCPVFLRGDRLFPKVANTQPARAQTVTATPVPGKSAAISTSAAKWIVVVAAIFSLVLISGWVFANTDIFTRTDPPVQAYSEIPPGITPTITRPVVEFAPNQTLIYDLTATVTDQNKMEATRSIPITGIGSMTATATMQPSHTPEKCVLPDGWVVYTVQLRDTLYWLSQSVTASVEEIMQVNCLTSETLAVGQQIFLPKMPPKIIFTATSTYIPTTTAIPPNPIPTLSPIFTVTPEPPAPTDTSEPQPTPEPLPTETLEPTPTANPEI